MQKVTGTLNPGAHPGSYNGQDAWNDMLIPGVCGTEPTSRRHSQNLIAGGGKECLIKKTSTVL